MEGREPFFPPVAVLSCTVLVLYCTVKYYIESYFIPFYLVLNYYAAFCSITLKYILQLINYDFFIIAKES